MVENGPEEEQKAAPSSKILDKDLDQKKSQDIDQNLKAAASKPQVASLRNRKGKNRKFRKVGIVESSPYMSTTNWVPKSLDGWRREPSQSKLIWELAMTFLRP